MGEEEAREGGKEAGEDFLVPLFLLRQSISQLHSPAKLPGKRSLCFFTSSVFLLLWSSSSPETAPAKVSNDPLVAKYSRSLSVFSLTIRRVRHS